MSSNEQNKTPIRVALAVTPTEEPSMTVGYMKMLLRETAFESTILEIHPMSIFSKLINSIAKICFLPNLFTAGDNKSDGTVDKVFDLDGRIESNKKFTVKYLYGEPKGLVNTIKSKFDLIIIPHCYIRPSIYDFFISNSWLQLVISTSLPVLFCPLPKKWQRLIFLEQDSKNIYGDVPTMNYLLRLLDKEAMNEGPKDLPTISFHSDDPVDQSYRLKPFLNVSEMSPDKQIDTILIASSKIACSIGGYRKLRKLLKNWQGNVLIFPD